MRISRFCTQQAMNSENYQSWASRLKQHPGHMHRKIWEWCFVCDELSQGGMLKKGKNGLGFAVGEESLTALFASQGVNIVATDLAPDDARASGWINTGQHAATKQALNKSGLCDKSVFDELVSFRYVDMNAIPDELREGRFDFIWSSCAFEHLGNLSKGLEFVMNSLDCLRSGGIAIHTTEFNVGSNDATIESGDVSIYRRKDIEKLQENLAAVGAEMTVDWAMGDLPLDYCVDVPPFSHNPHLKLRIGEYTVTSIGLVINKA